MKLRICLNYRKSVFLFALFALCLKASSSPTTEEVQKWDQLMADIPKTIKLSKNLPEAIRMNEEAIDLARKFGPTDTHLSQSQNMLPDVYLWEKNYDLAEQ